MDLIAPLLTIFAVVALVLMLCWPAGAQPGQIRTRTAIPRPVPSLVPIEDDVEDDFELDPGCAAMWHAPTWDPAPVPLDDARITTAYVRPTVTDTEPRRASGTLRYPTIDAPHPDETAMITLPAPVPEAIDPETTEPIFVVRDDDAYTGPWMVDGGFDDVELDD